MDQLLTLQQVAADLNVSPNRVRAQAATGDCPSDLTVSEALEWRFVLASALLPILLAHPRQPVQNEPLLPAPPNL